MVLLLFKSSDYLNDIQLIMINILCKPSNQNPANAGELKSSQYENNKCRISQTEGGSKRSNFIRSVISRLHHKPELWAKRRKRLPDC